MGGKRAAKRRHDGWTERRRDIFLKTLSERANVSAAARAAGMSTTGAYKLRRADPEFAQNWETALDSAMAELEAVAYERAMFGVERQVVRWGGSVTIRDYPNNLRSEEHTSDVQSLITRSNAVYCLK